jgi:aminomethyltransferase
MAGIPVLISRTGYTGEDGFEIYVPWDRAGRIWSPLVEAGAVPCGLGARDTLRLEAALPLYGHEIDDQTTPIEASLGWIVKMEKGDFIGRGALRKAPVRKRLVGIEMREPGIARQGNAVLHDGNQVGIIVSGTKAPFLGRAIATGFVRPEFAAVGTKLGIDIHHKTRHAEVVSLPFYRREKK